MSANEVTDEVTDRDGGPTRPDRGREGGRVRRGVGGRGSFPEGGQKRGQAARLDRKINFT